MLNRFFHCLTAEETRTKVDMFWRPIS